MVGTKLKNLEEEAKHYLGIPYFSNTKKLAKDNLYVGKSNWQEIKSISIDYKNLKKNHIGIDCSGLACQLLNSCLGTSLDVRKTSANMLTSSPLATPISNYPQIQPGDLIRQENGHHVIIIIRKNKNTLHCVESSLRGRGVRFLQVNLSSQPQIFRLTSLQ